MKTNRAGIDPRPLDLGIELTVSRHIHPLRSLFPGDTIGVQTAGLVPEIGKVRLQVADLRLAFKRRAMPRKDLIEVQFTQLPPS